MTDSFNPVLNRDKLSSMREEMREELYRILNFWSTEVYQKSSESFIGRIDNQGNKYPEAELGCVLISRILWTFSAAFKQENKQEYQKVASTAFTILIDKFWDKTEGGLYWSVSPNGKLLNDKKQAYAQGFGLYGLSEYYSAFGSKEALDYSQQLYTILEEKFYDTRYGGYWEALDANWNQLADLRLSEKDKNYPKTMNTHLHILEPYANLFKYEPSEKLRVSLEELLKLFLNKIINSDSGHFDLFFERDWTAVYSGESYGHDIEGAWLMREAALLVKNPDLLGQVETASLRLVNSTLQEGTDLDGSLFNERHGENLDSDKHWWPQAEAMVGLMDAWEIENKTSYLNQIELVWTFIKSYMIDLEKGEWFWRVDKNGSVVETEDKAGFWKCPYHNSRALIELIHRIDENLL